MYKIATPIANRIKQPSQCCIYCGKSYVKKNNLNNHIIICELLNKTSKEEEILELPSQQTMFQLIIELTKKCNKLEHTIQDINKNFVKKKNNNINILEWLNEHKIPSISFHNLIDSILITEQDITFLFDNNFYDTLNLIFTRTIYNYELDNPICCFTQKKNTFYIFDLDRIWIEITKEQLIKFLNRIHIKILKTFNDFQNAQKKEKKENQSFIILCEKTTYKLMNIEFTEDPTLSKAKNIMYKNMNIDITTL